VLVLCLFREPDPSIADCYASGPPPIDYRVGILMVFNGADPPVD